MPITIQEIIASDTISQLVDKTNFNFDQLLLNGGGPGGPAGPQGPVGPAGGRGLKGSTWYDDTSPAAVPPVGVSPNVVAPTLTPQLRDYYLQLDGQVWEYNGTTWVQTTVDLQGPVGPTGANGNFGLITGYGPGVAGLNNLNTVYNDTVGTVGTGANASNEGVPSVMIGGVATNLNVTPVPTIPLTNAYQVPVAITTYLASDIASLLLHQKEASSRALIFHGGNSNPAELYEQSNINQLSGIAIGVDDKLILGVPKTKVVTAGSTQASMRGLELQTPTRSQNMWAGSDILLQSGVAAGGQLFANQHSNIVLDVGAGGSVSGTTGNKLQLITQGTLGTTLIEAGNNIVNATTTSLVGKIQATAGRITLVSALSGTNLYSSGNIYLDTLLGGSGSIIGRVGTGNVDVSTMGGWLQLSQSNAASAQGIVLNNSGSGIILLQGRGDLEMKQISTTSTGNITIENRSQTGGANAGDIYITGKSQIIIREYNIAATAAPSIVLDYEASQPHTRLVGQQTWASDAVGGAGTLPPLPGIQKYTNTASALLTPYDGGWMGGTNTGNGSVLNRFGKNNTTDMSLGVPLTDWMGGLNAATNRPSNTIGIYQGGAGYNVVFPGTGPMPLTSPQMIPTVHGMEVWSEALDSSLMLSVRTVPDTQGGGIEEEYFTVSKNKTFINTPIVLGRQQTNYQYKIQPRRAQNNSDSGARQLGWGWDTSWGTPAYDTVVLGNFIGQSMPSTRDLSTPAIMINIGRGIGRAGQSPVDVNANYNIPFNFPVGQFPGQELTLMISHWGSWFRASGTDYGAWGKVRINVPRFRRRSPGNAATWTSWWANGTTVGNQNTTIPDDGTRSYYQIVSNISEAEAKGNFGVAPGNVVKNAIVKMIWDGSYRSNFLSSEAHPTGATPEDGHSQQIQMGWVVYANSTNQDGFGTAGLDT